jgi:hypothetical protein
MRASDSRSPLSLFSLKCPNDKTFVLHRTQPELDGVQNKRKAVSEGLRYIGGYMV